MKYLKKLLSLAATAALLFLTIAPATPASAAPAITLSTSIGVMGQQVTISGSGFDSSYYVNIIFGKNPGTNLDYTSGYYSILQVLPIGATGTFSAVLTVPNTLDDGSFNIVSSGTYYFFATYQTTGGQNTNTVLGRTPFTVLGGDMTLSKSSGPAGTEVVMSGSGFTGSENLIVEFDESEILTPLSGGTALANGMASNVKVYVPSSTAGVHSLSITGETSNHKIGALFTVEPSMQFRPDPGIASSKIDVYGIGFGASTTVAVKFNNVTFFNGTTESNGSFATSFPAGQFPQASYIVSVTDGLGNTAQTTYDIFDASITMDPTVGSPGWDVALSGDGFQENEDITISFEGISSAYDVTATTDAEGAFSTVFSVLWPDMGTYDVTVSDGTNTKSIPFEVNTSSNIYPVTNSASPGYVGTQISIAGAGFTPGRTVTVTFSGTQVATGTVGSDGIFNDIIFPAPSAPGGNHLIEATDGTHSIAYGFVLETDPPSAPLTIEPASGEKAKAETFFDWSDVEDESDVTYTLQIATDQNFNNIVLEKTAIIGSEYTLLETEQLNSVVEDAPYYWRVAAVDLARNQSPWTQASAMYVSFGFSLPQAVVYVLIIGGALLLSGFTFWLGRKTAYY